VARIFSTAASWLRLIHALVAELLYDWVTGKLYLSGAIGHDKGAKKQAMKIQEAV